MPLPCLYSADVMSPQPVMAWRKSKFYMLSLTACCIALILNTFAGLVFILGRSRNSFALALHFWQLTWPKGLCPFWPTASPLTASSMAVDTNVSASDVACSTVISAWSRMDDIAAIRRDLLVPFPRVVVVCMLPVNIVSTVDVLDDLRFCSTDLVEGGPW